jgi:pantoate--beta-alanine ligase
MGALHEGHASLIRRAKKECGRCIVSIFVNPTQFGPKEDFKRYPRPLGKDKEMLRRLKVDALFLPTATAMYPEGFMASVETGALGQMLCGRSRPGHFNGVATVVVKLLNIVGADVLYLGQKDAQQAMILKRIVADFNFPTRIRICPTVRSASGLALSSRNQYLNDEERRQAPALYRSLKAAAQAIKKGERSSPKLILLMRSLIRRHTHGSIDYVACVDAATLKMQKTIKGNVLLALAVRFRKTRLIDNMIVKAT